VDTTPEVRRATALAAWLGTWFRDEEARSHGPSVDQGDVVFAILAGGVHH
jgi:hypothetical protein